MKNLGFTPLEFLKNLIGEKYKNGKALTGFTIIELLVAVTVLVLATSLILPGFNFFQRQSALDAAGQEIVSALRLAQNQTLASEGASSFGVYFDNDKFTVFKGTSFYPSSPDNNIHPLNPSLTISAANLNGNNFIVFDRLTGNAPNYGYIKIEQVSDSTKNKTIFVYSDGVVSSSSYTPSDSPRQKDSRRVEFTYNQNTQNASTLRLYFPSANVTEDINFQNYLNAGKTEFDWSGAVSVSGSDQKIKIHTLSLTLTNAVFCVHRDRRYNSQDLNIFLDDQNLLNYSPTGTTTKGTSILVDEPILQ